MKVLISTIMILIILSTSVSAQTIGVLCYHSVTDNPLRLSDYVIGADEFEADVKYFKEQGYNIVKPCGMWYAEGDKNVVFTFDDGYDDFYYNVFPILKKYNVCAAVYIIGSKINKKGYLSSAQIKELYDSGLVEIGNHTHIMHKREKAVLQSYHNDAVLVGEVVWDIQRCSDEVARITGKPTESMAYPYGVYSTNLDMTLRSLGYTTTFSTAPGILKEKADFQKPIKRIYRIHGDTPEKMVDAINKYRR